MTFFGPDLRNGLPIGLGSVAGFGIAPRFSPASLFTGGVQGAWYDPSDPTTLFSDRAGTTPCGTPGGGSVVPVGAMLDERAPAYSVFFDGTGDYLSLTGVNLSSGNWTIECWVNFSSFTGTSSPHIFTFGTDNNNRYNVWRNNSTGKFSFNSANAGVFTNTDGTTTPVIGAWYHVAVVRSAGVTTLYINGVAEVTNSANINGGTNWAIGAMQFNIVASDYLNGYISNFRVVAGTAVYTANFTPPTSPLSPITGTSLLTCGTSWTGNPAITKNGDARVDGLNPFTASPVGNHAIAANDTTARPELSARVNLLTYTEQFDNAAWANNGGYGTIAAITPNVAIAPDGTNTADRMSLTTTTQARRLQGVILGSANTQYTFSAYVKSEGQQERIALYLGVDGNQYWTESLYPNVSINFATNPPTVNASTGLAFSGVNAGNGWWKLSFTATRSSNLLANTIFMGWISEATETGKNVLIWGADLRPANIGSSIPSYQRIVDANTYDAVGFPRYLRAVGSNTGMYTPSTINLGGDAVTAFAGVRKQSDAALGIIMESSATIASNNGAFLLSAPNSAEANYNFSSKGTVQTNNTVSAYAAPISNVVTAQGDISDAVNTIRVNGLQVGSNANPQGTGNYGTYSLNLFGRNAQSGTATAGTILNGDLYSAILVAGLVSSGNVSSTEGWIAGKMGIAAALPTDYNFLTTATGDQLTTAAGDPLFTSAIY